MASPVWCHIPIILANQGAELEKCKVKDYTLSQKCGGKEDVWVHNLRGEHISSRWEALGSIPSPVKMNLKKMKSCSQIFTFQKFKYLKRKILVNFRISKYNIRLFSLAVWPSSEYHQLLWIYFILMWLICFFLQNVTAIIIHEFL